MKYYPFWKSDRKNEDYYYCLVPWPRFNYFAEGICKTLVHLFLKKKGHVALWLVLEKKYALFWQRSRGGTWRYTITQGEPDRQFSDPAFLFHLRLKFPTTYPTPFRLNWCYMDVWSQEFPTVCLQIEWSSLFLKRRVFLFSYSYSYLEKAISWQMNKQMYKLSLKRERKKLSGV